MRLESYYRRVFIITCLALGFLGGVLMQTTHAESAKQAIAALRSAKGSGITNAIVFMRGRNGQHQPSEWELVVSDPSVKGQRRILMGNKRVLSEGNMTHMVRAAPIPLNQLRIDSTDAFRISDAEARRVRLGFDSVDYELRTQPNGYAPMWVVMLRDIRGTQVALLEISGESGQVLRRKWQSQISSEAQGRTKSASREHNAQPVPDPGIYREKGTAKVNYRKYETVPDGSRVERKHLAFDHLWRRSTDGFEYAGEKMKNGFGEIGGSFSDIFSGKAVYRSSGKNRYASKRRKFPGGASQ